MRNDVLTTVTVAAALCGCGASDSSTTAAVVDEPAADKPEPAAPAAKPRPDLAARHRRAK